MPKEKRSNLAIYTLAGSILLSSVIVSMNQANGGIVVNPVPTSPAGKSKPIDTNSKNTSDISSLSYQIRELKDCVNSNFRRIGSSRIDIKNEIIWISTSACK